MKVRHLLLPLGFLLGLAACSGGGGSNSSALPAIATNAPVPGVSAAASPGVSASPAAAIPSPSAPSPAAPLALATGGSIGIDGGTLDPRQIGTLSVFPNDSAVNTAPSPIPNASFNQIDAGIDASGQGSTIPAEYNINEGGRHTHTHITILNADGQRVIFPQGIGMIGDSSSPLRTFDLPGQSFSLNQFTAGGTTGTYFVHTHDHTGFVHAEDDPALDTQYGIHPPSQYTLGHLLKLMGETADANHFTKYLQGHVHIYISHVYVVNPSGPQDASNEIQTAPVEWKGDPFAVPAIAPDDFGKIPLESFEEITVEIGDTYHPVPRYYFPWYWCQSNPANGQTDCGLDAAPAGVQAAAVMQRMPSSLGPRI